MTDLTHNVFLFYFKSDISDLIPNCNLNRYSWKCAQLASYRSGGGRKLIFLHLAWPGLSSFSTTVYFIFIPNPFKTDRRLSFDPFYPFAVTTIDGTLRKDSNPWHKT